MLSRFAFGILAASLLAGAFLWVDPLGTEPLVAARGNDDRPDFVLAAVPSISEIHPSGSGNGTYAADWFEITNTGTTALDITGWRMDDNSNSFGSSVPLRGVTSIPAGRSAVFFEGAATNVNDATITAAFSTAWFGSATPPAGFLIGAYGGTGVGLGTGGDTVNLYDAAGTLITSVTFGTAAANATFDNTSRLGTVTALSVAGTNGAFLSSNGAETGSPGRRVNAVPLSSIDLSLYVRVGRYDLPEPTRTAAPPNNLLGQEASAVAYNWDTDTLFITGDGGTSITQVSKTGQLIDTMTLALGGSPQGTEFYDPEGLTYVGNGKFVMTEERDRRVVQFTYAPGTTLTRANAQTVTLGTFVQNIGLEGISYDPATSGFILGKEIDPQGVFQTTVDFAAGTASNGSATTVNSVNLFDPALMGLLDVADVYAMSNIPNLTGPDSNRLLVLSQESGRIINISRSGVIANSLTIRGDAGNPLTVPAQQHEGMTMDWNGNLYVVSENGGGDFDHPQMWVYQRSSVPNQAPTAITLNNRVNSIVENTNTAAPIKVADISITDDDLGTNNLTITGPDAAFFQITGFELFIKAGTVLDFETKSSYSISVNVDDPSIGATPDATVGYTLAVTDLVNETPPLNSLIFSEVAPWSSGNSPVQADWFEITNTTANPINIAGWKVDDSSNSFTTAVDLAGITTIAAGESVIFLESGASNQQALIDSFKQVWFGANVPSGLQIGTYTGAGIGLSTGGDALNLYNAAGVLQANVVFGVSPAGPAFPTFNNAAGLNNTTISTLSGVGVNGAFAAAADANEIGSPGNVGRVIISEVAAWASGNSNVQADWFEVTNTRATAVDITDWKFDDSSGSPAAAVPLLGITSIGPGESVIFLETADPVATAAAFRSAWFGSAVSNSIRIGSYTGGGVGLSTGGDAVNLYSANNVLQASVIFGTSPAGPAFGTFDNSRGLNNVTISQLSVVGVNGAFNAANPIAGTTEIGSPGVIVGLPGGSTNLAFSSTTYKEDESQTAVVTVNRTGVTTGATSGNVTLTSGGRAVGGAACTTGVDYVNTPQPITFAAGATTATANIVLCGDVSADTDETVNLTLTGLTSGTGASNTAVLTINDTANQFKNAAAISINNGIQGGLYPSPIVVSGATNNAFRIRVTLYDYYTTLPDNLDVLLVGPNGAKYALVGDVGGPNEITQNGKVTLTLADYPNAVLPDAGPLVTGIFKPTTCETPVTNFPAPAPAGPYVEPGCVVARTNAQTLFGNFGGSTANGTWNLYVRDDGGVARPDAPEFLRGEIQGGWGIELLPSTAAGVEVSGRVLTPDGRGLRNATVTITDSMGNRRTATTSSFGFYHFTDVEAGGSYSVSVTARRYRFTPRIVQVQDTLTDVDFVGQE
ncbi:MAG: lamin tail domain-containing protein [Pyrinomonadaceae bacterium]